MTMRTLPTLRPSGGWRRPAAYVGALFVVAYAVVAAIQILVLNPLAAVPGSTLDQIHGAVNGADDSMLSGLTVALLVPGPVVAIVTLWAAHRRVVPWVAALAVQLGLLALGAIVYWVASVGPGMALADTFAIGGADHSPWSIPLIVLSVIAGLALVAMGMKGVRRTLLQ